MFLAKWNNNDKEEFYIYFKNSNGYRCFCQDTFSPLIENINVLDLSVKGSSYNERKNNLIELAKEYQYNWASLSWSYGELIEIQDFFNKNGKKYGLLKEFRENAIC